MARTPHKAEAPASGGITITLSAVREAASVARLRVWARGVEAAGTGVLLRAVHGPSYDLHVRGACAQPLVDVGWLWAPGRAGRWRATGESPLGIRDDADEDSSAELALAFHCTAAPRAGHLGFVTLGGQADDDDAGAPREPYQPLPALARAASLELPAEVAGGTTRAPTAWSPLTYALTGTEAPLRALLARAQRRVRVHERGASAPPAPLLSPDPQAPASRPRADGPSAWQVAGLRAALAEAETALRASREECARLSGEHRRDLGKAGAALAACEIAAQQETLAPP